MSEVITVKVPDIGETSGVEVIEVAVQSGQDVEQDDAIITLESDKASMDIPCPQAGHVEEVLVKVGDKLSEGDEILRLRVQNQTQESTEAPESQSEPKQEKAQQDEPQQEEAQPPKEAQQQASSAVKTFNLPDLGTEAQVEVIEWSVEEGESVEKDQTLLTLESDKASMDVPCPYEGVVVKKLVQVGDKVSTGTPVAELRSQGGHADTTESKPSETKAPASPASKDTSTPSKPTASSTRPLPSQVGAHAGPGVRRLAHELGVDLTRVSGTGRKGRITYQDIHQYVKKQLTQPSQGSGPQLEPMPEIDFSQWGDIETKPLSRIKRLTAKNLHRNWVAIPHVTQFDEADITELEAFRQENKQAAKEMGISLTPLAFIVKACVSSLKAYPQFNASLAANQQDLILKKYYHIGVAVDTPNGLVVPVIKDADRKGVYQIAEELATLSHQARKGLLKSDQMKGSCFTVSSLGALGGTQFTPIINAPDVAILGVSKSAMKPVYQDGQFVPRLMMPLALSYDHRVIDGVEGAKFMKHLCVQCEDIRKLLL